jgi:KDO2-lipid IV(A) lauroyltransferase
LGAWLMRRIGPLMREHGTGRANLKAAFPEKSDAEIENILRGVWDNLGRTGAEFVHTDRLWDYDPTDLARSRVMDITVPFGNLQRAVAPGKGVLYRRPNLSAVAKAVTDIRASCMGTMIPAGPAAPIQLAEAVERGEIVGLLVDQYYVRGVPVTFFGRRTRANPMIARLARHFDCAIHGTRAVRHPGNRFEFTITEAITLVRDAEGKIEVEGTMQAITDVIEGWVREHPEQWLWLHRRWRDE